MRNQEQAVQENTAQDADRPQQEASESSPAPLIQRIDLTERAPAAEQRTAGADVPELRIQQPEQPGRTTRETIDIDGHERQYFVHRPAGYDPSQKYPMVLVYNGYESGKRGQGGTAPGGEGMEEITGFSQKADQEKFLVVYMDGNRDQAHSWNNGQWWFSKLNDVKFTDAVMHTMQENFNVDENRIYLVGFSQGASFVHRAASELPHKVAAIADVSGWMSGLERPTATKIPMLSIQSKDDPTVPYDGRKMWLTMKPERYTSRFYRGINDIPDSPQVSIFHQQDGRQIMDRRYIHPSNGTEVRHVIIEGEGHVWFGGKGARNSQINATDIVWDFLRTRQKGRAPQEQQRFAE